MGIRSIEFRGKRVDNGEWVYGVPFFQENQCYMIEDLFICDEYQCTGATNTEVIPETVGQYTGICDKNGNGTKIFEGDIIKSKEYGRQQGDKNINGYDIFEVRFVDGAFVIKNSDRLFYLLRGADKEVIGNIHDNPELYQISVMHNITADEVANSIRFKADRLYERIKEMKPRE